FIDPEKTLNEFLRKESSLQEITYQHDSGINFIPASPAYQESQKNNSHQLSEIFEHLDDTTEFVLIDSPSGLGAEVSHVLKNSDEALIVVNPNLSSVMDALKTIKLAEEHNNIIAGIILNMSNRGKHELKPEEIEKILSHPIIGNIQQHKKMRKSLHQRMPVNHLFPKSAPAKQYQKIASYLCQNETD
ncbi:MAG: MinD/ParA family protein, partial [Nanoarchaeota archaeon]|nr:MinD/ParA family protein [Nanoarchaeota archaeon]